jgi:serine/threonine protein kinase
VAGKGIDRRCDVFACGIVLYEIVTGEQLFTGDSDFAIMDKVRNAEIRRPRSVVPTLSAAIENVILKALVADRDQRYAWCSEMREDLDKCGGATQPELEGWARWLFATKDDVAPPEPPPDGYDDFEESPGTDPDGGALPPGW